MSRLASPGPVRAHRQGAVPRPVDAVPGAAHGRRRTGSRGGAVARRAAAALTAVVAGLLLAAPGASAAVNCPDADAAPAEVGVERAAIAVECLVNHERQAAGLSPLATDGGAEQAARWHADDMASRGYFGHIALLGGPHGIDVGARLTNAGYTWTLVGENLARGQDTPRLAMAAWLASPGHCENLMRPAFVDAGFGVSTVGNGPYWAQVFARKMGVPTPLGPAVSCPRAPAVPAPTGNPGPASRASAGTPASAPAVPEEPVAVPTAPVAVPAKATVARKGRRLTVRVTVPAGTRRTTIVVRVRQAGKTVRTIRAVRAAGRTYRLRATLPAARTGRVTVRVAGKTIAASFR